MRLFKDKKFLFLGVPATRNTWSREVLADHLIQDVSLIPDYFNDPEQFMKVGSELRKAWPPHTPNYIVSRFCKLPRDSYKKIAVIRNPYERYVSMYEFMRKTPDHMMYPIASAQPFPVFMQNIAVGNCSFDCRPQTYFLRDNRGNLDIEHLFTFAQVEEFKQFFTGLGYEINDVPVSQASRDWKSYYDAPTVRLVDHIEWFETMYFQWDKP